MTSSALLTHKGIATLAIGTVAVAATLGAGSSRAQAVGATAASPVVSERPQTAADGRSDPYAARFPNFVLKTHEGKTVRFYDDLLKGKIVVINFMYTTCKGR